MNNRAGEGDDLTFIENRADHTHVIDVGTGTIGITENIGIPFIHRILGNIFEQFLHRWLEGRIVSGRVGMTVRHQTRILGQQGIGAVTAHTDYRMIGDTFNRR